MLPPWPTLKSLLAMSFAPFTAVRMISLGCAGALGLPGSCLSWIVSVFVILISFWSTIVVVVPGPAWSISVCRFCSVVTGRSIAWAVGRKASRSSRHSARAASLRAGWRNFMDVHLSGKWICAAARAGAKFFILLSHIGRRNANLFPSLRRAQKLARQPRFSPQEGEKAPRAGEADSWDARKFRKKTIFGPGGESHSSRRRASRRFWEEKMQGRGGEPCGSAPRPWPPVRRRLSRCTRRRRSRRRRGIRSHTSRGARRGSRPPCRGTGCRGSRSSCPRRRARSACGR